ncbi:hypothetical protein IE994_15675 [Enterobacter hormaechei]|nr:hypothetical protein [Enterobacter hormaechei]MBD3717209.1 hypothetical protein [Enterobacter hormaechei]
MLIASCVTNGSVPVVVDTGCDWVKPIFLTDQDIDVLDRQTKKRHPRRITKHGKQIAGKIEPHP